jgi:DNA topoisomerase VI subunit B
MTTHALKRTTFKTSRLLEFCSTRELTNLVGHDPDEWPLVVLKELVDNGLDAAEEAGVAPFIEIAVSTADRSISVTDNGPGFPARTVASILDFSARTSSKEAYCSPTRGQQGHALSTILAMPFALAQGDEAPGYIVIEANGLRHEITLRYDQIRRVPTPKHERSPSSVKTGTRFAVHWPVSSTLRLTQAEARFLQIADGYAWLNPHMGLKVTWDGEVQLDVKAFDAAWKKWLPSDPTSPHWYDHARFERRVAAQIAHDLDRKKDTLVREFIVEFRGLSGTARQKAVLDKVGGARVPLSSLYGDDGFNKTRIAKLLAAIRAETKLVQPKQLGLIGSTSLAWRFMEAGADVGGRNFHYRCIEAENDGRPCLVETAFVPCKQITRRRLVVGVNWSPSISGNPFKAIGAGGDSLDSLLASLRVQHHDKAILVVHVACPTVQYIDRGKAAMTVGGEAQLADEDDTFDDREAS